MSAACLRQVAQLNEERIWDRLHILPGAIPVHLHMVTSSMHSRCCCSEWQWLTGSASGSVHKNATDGCMALPCVEV